MDRATSPRCASRFNSAYIAMPTVNALERALLGWHCHAVLQAQMRLFGALPAWGSRPRPPPLSGSLPNRPQLVKAKGTFELPWTSVYKWTREEGHMNQHGCCNRQVGNP